MPRLILTALGLFLVAPTLGCAANQPVPVMPLLHWEKLPPLPDAEGYAAPFAGIANDALIVAGGAKFPDKRPWDGGSKQWYDTVYVLPSTKAEWKIAGRLPRVCAYGVSVSTATGVVCAGGGDSHQHFREVFLLRWDGTTVTAEPLPSLPQPCAFGSGAIVGTIFYLAGGLATPDSTEALHTFWALDLAEQPRTWRELQAWPGNGRMLAVSGAGADTFYLFSGVALQPDANGKAVRRYLNDGYAYAPLTGWKKLADLPRPAVAAASPAPTPDGRHFLLLSGDDGTRTQLNGPNHPGFPRDVLIYDSLKDRWALGSEMPFSRATVPTVRWGSHWILPSGERIPGIRSPEVWSLSFDAR